MAINIPVHHDYSKDSKGLAQFLKELCRRALDSSINPAQMNVGLNVTGNDITIVTAGNGLILTSRNGLHTYRLLIENDGTISADQLT